MVVMMVIRASDDCLVSNLTEAPVAEYSFRVLMPALQRALDNPGAPLYNAASSEGKSSGPDATPVNDSAKEHQARDFCFRNWSVCSSGNRMKLLECLLSRL
jgi:hypothetical protein